MTHEQKINYMRISAGIAGFTMENKYLDLLVSMYELVMKKQGSAKLDEIVEVELQVREREKERKVKQKEVEILVKSK